MRLVHVDDDDDDVDDDDDGDVLMFVPMTMGLLDIAMKENIGLYEVIR